MSIRTNNRGTTPNIPVVQQTNSRAAEAYRSLRTTLQYSPDASITRTVLIADAGTGNQGPTVAANLAAAIALGGDQTLLIDADLRAPSLHETFGLDAAPGLGDWALDRSTNAPVQPTTVQGLDFLSAGMVEGISPADLLSAERTTTWLAEFSEAYRFVLINAPELGQFSDALNIAAHVDGVLLLVRSGTTRRKQAQRAREALDRVGAHILGAVLTDSVE